MRKSNMALNGEWANHARPRLKRKTNKLRRADGRRQIKEGS